MKTFKILILPALAFFCVLSAYADNANRKIVKVFEDENLKKGYITLFLSDGEIIHFRKSNELLRKKVLNFYKEGKLIYFVQEERSLKAKHKALIVKDIYSNANSFSDSHRNSNNNSFKETVSLLNPKNVIFEEDRNFDPLEQANLTLFSTYQEAQEVMNSFNGKTADKSQCYNRSHMWTFEVFQSSDATLNLGKTWIFFTHKYIREFDYKWWFHTAPFAKVDDANGMYLLDRGFTRIPYNLKNWTDLFMKNNSQCREVVDYLKYENNQESEYCYLIHSNQFFWQPYQLKNLSARGNLKVKYQLSDLKLAYKDALIFWDETIPGYEQEDTSTDDDIDLPTNESRRPPVSVPSNGPVVVGGAWVKVGDRVINSNGFEGRVTGIINSQKANIRFKNSYNSVSVRVQYLARTYGSSNSGLAVGDRVKSPYGVIGTVSGVFKDGAVSVMYRNAQKHIWQKPSQLTRI